MSENYGDDFQQRSKYSRENLPSHSLDWSKKPEVYKIYPNPIIKIDLPKPIFDDKVGFWKIVLNRHSSRQFSESPLTIMDLSMLLYGTMGLNRIYLEDNYSLRVTPSAGGLFPIETYVAINNVETIDQGIYHYDIQNHALEGLKKGDFKKKMAEACLGQRMAYYSAVNFIWTAIVERSKWKYLQRCYRYIYLDSGHIGQNFYLISEALDLSCCVIGAIFDDEINTLLDIDGKEEFVVYIGVVGKKEAYY